MKHNFKRVFALLLAVVMCLTCTLPVFATNGETGACPEAGVAAKHMDFSREAWLDVIEKTVPPKTVEINKKAFLLGFEG